MNRAMNGVGDWFIPILVTCLVHGAITIVPIHFTKRNDPVSETIVTLKLVSLPQVSLLPAGGQSGFLPEKKPFPPKKIYQDKNKTAAPIPPRPIARSQNRAKVETELPQSASAQETSTASNVAAMQPGTGIGTGIGTGAGTGGGGSDPVMLSSELSVICPVLNPPPYPRQSRQLGEEGKLTLKLELNENGRVKEIQVLNSSGYQRLDEAAIAAVKSWRCNPPLQNGQPVRAIALQPFSFVLEE
ncbi:energy transducer TonB [Nitrosomonas sp. Nm166]|uniref:energy transducer TonB n=1 Tax=Nitrosomonas sp. Nm166 TaxID=1881054 RepID=UPI0008E4C6BC|nr:energy transducer TonB [Nitrosomonas sp. Nm166]SFE02759.1 protein TonB [Nitrosomonas sp. Nm166]